MGLLRSRKVRALLAFLGWGAQFVFKPSPFISGLVLLTSIAWVIFLFWPEIKRIRIVNDPAKTVLSESPAWLYIFAVAAVLAVSVWGGSIYYSVQNAPRILTADEFAEPFIRGKHFRLSDFIAYAGGNVIAGRTFEDCWIYGPAVVVASGVGILHKNVFDAQSFEEVFWEVPTDHPIRGVINLRDCTFRRCVFVGVAFVGTKEQIAKWKAENQEIREGQ
jgi:hypothetical protein